MKRLELDASSATGGADSDAGAGATSSARTARNAVSPAAKGFLPYLADLEIILTPAQQSYYDDWITD